MIAMPLCDESLMDRLRACQAEGRPGLPRDELLGVHGRAGPRRRFPQRAAPSGRVTASLVGVQHRDIKPHNIFLVGGSARLADFGLAKILEATQRQPHREHVAELRGARRCSKAASRNGPTSIRWPSPTPSSAPAGCRSRATRSTRSSTPTSTTPPTCRASPRRSAGWSPAPWRSGPSSAGRPAARSCAASKRRRRPTTAGSPPPVGPTLVRQPVARRHRGRHAEPARDARRDDRPWCPPTVASRPGGPGLPGGLCPRPEVRRRTRGSGPPPGRSSKPPRSRTRRPPAESQTAEPKPRRSRATAVATTAGSATPPNSADEPKAEPVPDACGREDGGPAVRAEPDRAAETQAPGARTSTRAAGPDPELAQQAHALLKKYCYRCHGVRFEVPATTCSTATSWSPARQGRAGLRGARQARRVVSLERVGVEKDMPPSGPKPSDDERALIGPGSRPGHRSRPPTRRPARSRPRATCWPRSATTCAAHARATGPTCATSRSHNLHNNKDVSDDDLRLARAAVAKLVNSLSWKTRDRRPEGDRPRRRPSWRSTSATSAGTSATCGRRSSRAIPMA